MEHRPGNGTSLQHEVPALVGGTQAGSLWHTCQEHHPRVKDRSRLERARTRPARPESRMPIRGDHPTPTRPGARSTDDRGHASSDAWRVAQATRGGVRPVRNPPPEAHRRMDRRARRLLARGRSHGTVDSLREPTSRLPLHSLVQHERGQQAGRRGRCDRVVLGWPGRTTRADAPHPHRARRREHTNSRARMSRQDAGWRVRPKSVHGRGVESSIPPANRLDRTPGNDRQHPCPPLGGGRRDGHQRSLVDRWRRFDPAGPGWPASTKDRPVPGPSYVGIPRGLPESSRFDRSTAGGVRMVRSVSLEPAS